MSKKTIKEKRIKKSIKKPKKRYTQKQQKLISAILENLGNTNKPKSMYQMMLDSGYAETSARSQNEILIRIEGDDSVLGKLVKHRDKVFENLETRLPQAEYRDLVRSMDMLVKNIELLSGRPTERLDHQVDEETAKKLDDILYAN